MQSDFRFISEANFSNGEIKQYVFGEDLLYIKS